MQENVGSNTAIYNCFLLDHDHSSAGAGFDKAKCLPGVVHVIYRNFSSHLVLNIIHSLREEDGLFLLQEHWALHAMLLCQRLIVRGSKECENHFFHIGKYLLLLRIQKVKNTVLCKICLSGFDCIAK